MLQTQTPEAMLGRINGLWTAQNVTGDAIGAALLGEYREKCRKELAELLQILDKLIYVASR